MKVLVFTTQFWKLGGAERLAVDLAVDLNQRGVRADILSMYGADLAGVKEAQQVLYTKGIPAIWFLGLRSRPNPFSALGAIIRLRRLIRDERYAIVETSMVGPRLLTTCATFGLPTRHVAGAHDVFTKRRYSDGKGKLSRYFIRMDGRTRFYAISEYVKKYWIEYSATPPEHTRTVYNGVPNEAFSVEAERDALRKELSIPSDARLALFVGRMLKRKGVDTALEALGPILEQENLYLIYVGALDEPPDGLFPGEGSLLRTMDECIVREGWSDHVKMLGLRTDVPRLMAASDVLVHPARLEGFGLVLAEALATGLPVVASNVEAIPEVLGGTDSLLVPPDDPIALRAAVQRTLSRTPTERAIAERKGRARAESFRLSHRTEAMIQLFEDVVSETF